MVSGLLAVLVLAGGPDGPDQKAPQRYKLDLKIVQSLDLTPMGSGVVDSDATASVFIAVTMSDTVGGKLAHVVVDSMTVNATGQMATQFTAEQAIAAKGQFIHAYIVDGKVKGTPTFSIEGNTSLGLAGSALPALFLGTPAGKKSGDRWSDTTTAEIPAGVEGMTGESITDWVATGADGDAIVLTGTQKGTIAGDVQGQSISGTTEGTIEATSTTGGPAKSATIITNQNVEVLVPQAPDVIRVKNTTTAVVTQLP